MLTLLAYSMVVVFMFLIMTKRLPALTALILVPIAFALMGGFGKDLGPMMLSGIKNLAPTGIMLMFAILYFGIMIDAGLFDPVVRKILKLVHGDPMKIVVGTAVLAMIVSLDGDGSTTYMITVSAMLPLYQRLGINRMVLACVIMLAGGVFNILPWGGPTARAASALGVDVGAIFVPMIPAMIFSAAWVLFVAWMLGKKERARLGTIAMPGAGSGEQPSASLVRLSDPATARPHLLWVNAGLTVALLGLLIWGAFPLPVLFMVAFAIAIVINYPQLDEQKERIATHAANALPVVALIFAAGVFVGILSGTKMVDAIAHSVIEAIPPSLGPYMATVTGILSIPFTFFISNDAFYFGVVPILAKAAAVYGISAAEIGRASIVGQPVHLLSPLVASTYLLVGMAKVEFGDHQRYTLMWSLSASVVMFLGAMLCGVIPFVMR
ncbi:citrate-Mg2+:H+ or citrate-Ca2+:H+ symporter, CitMHS family [Noviherbaspirillum humi]|uniref:Citrate-Mg2+:H+ or citrate-Ca2+:H+ symporter, CitMHS family n=1 Tax=Noviherbaspirillum humi TaxID=1688639 RepID=A0A239LBA9_9BURK|nr:CitMHS family transporter [Noviherbaspirillum humi]SNT27927.1 citrate-Mg2+:H+ or citrate-Ca2+:H+ symporter, CitMHS family [Noviherbaspirillum humi]